MDPNKGTMKHCSACSYSKKIEETLDDGSYLLECGHVVVPEHLKH